MKTCKDCEHYLAPPDWSEKEEFYCYKIRLWGGYKRAIKNCSQFTPKPAEKPGQAKIAPEEYLRRQKAEYDRLRYEAMRGIATPDRVIPYVKKEPPQKKENKMIKQTLRRYMTACTMYVTVRVAILLHPLICKIWYLVPLPWEKLSEDGGGHVWPWILTLAGIFIIAVTIYGFNRFTAFIFGEK